jgi:ribonuclease P protein component
VNHRLGTDQRIKKKREFQQLFDEGKSLRGKFFILRILEGKPGTGKDLPRCAVTVSKKIDLRAAVRNLWKRRAKEAFRRNQHLFKPGLAILFQARSGVKTQGKAPSYQEIEQELKMLLEKQGLLK